MLKTHGNAAPPVPATRTTPVEAPATKSADAATHLRSALDRFSTAYRAIFDTETSNRSVRYAVSVANAQRGIEELRAAAQTAPALAGNSAVTEGLQTLQHQVSGVAQAILDQEQTHDRIEADTGSPLDEYRVSMLHAERATQGFLAQTIGISNLEGRTWKGGDALMARRPVKPLESPEAMQHLSRAEREIDAARSAWSGATTATRAAATEESVQHAKQALSALETAVTVPLRSEGRGSRNDLRDGIDRLGASIPPMEAGAQRLREIQDTPDQEPGPDFEKANDDYHSALHWTGIGIRDARYLEDQSNAIAPYLGRLEEIAARA